MNTGLSIYNSEETPAKPDDWVVEYAPLVKRIAHHMKGRLPPTVQIDDLIQAGMIGLLQAARNYDAGQGASFSTYAGIRIRGAMLDESRKGNWAPRSVNQKLRQMSEAVRKVEGEHRREARDTEVAAEMGIELDEYFGILQEVNYHQVLSFDEEFSNDGAHSASLEGDDDPLEELQRDGFRKHLAEVIASLPERERMVVSLYYDEDLNLREIGSVLGVTESRVCQIHAQAMVRLRARMSDWTR